MSNCPDCRGQGWGYERFSERHGVVRGGTCATCSGSGRTVSEKLKRILAVLSTTPNRLTPAEKRAQRISWAYGQVKFQNPDLTREEVERLHDEVYGPLEEEGPCPTCRGDAIVYPTNEPHIWEHCSTCADHPGKAC